MTDIAKGIALVLANIVSGVIGLVVFVFVVGWAIETRVQHIEDHDRCLRSAMNGYEIRQCDR